MKTKLVNKNGTWSLIAGDGARSKTVGQYNTLRAAERAEAAYIRAQVGVSLSRDARLELVIDKLGSTCCKMAFKMSYALGFPLQEICELLGVNEEDAEKAVQAGEYSLNYLRVGTAARLTKLEVEQAVGSIFE